MKKTGLIILVLMFWFLAGCATYNTRGAVPILSGIEEKKLVKLEREGIIITAFPIATKEDSKKYFDENLSGFRIIGKRILAVYLDVSNKTSGAVKVASVSLKVGEAVIPSATAEVVYQAIRREYAVKAFLWIFPTFYVGAIPSVIHTSFINSRIEKDVKNKQFVLGREIINSSQGFVWFQLGSLPKSAVLDIILEISGKGMVLYGLPIL